MLTYLRSERFNFFSHLLGLILWVPLTGLLLLMTWGHWDRMAVSLVYGASACFMFYSSAFYHRHKKQESERSLRRTLDHFAIFVMIAGSYTPIIAVWFLSPANIVTLSLQWGLTVLGFLLAVFVPKRPRWVDPVLYILMGWVALAVMGYLWVLMERKVFFAMVAGGVLYTAGAVIYGLKKPNFKPGVFGFHELFHVFIIAGAGAHYLMVLWSVT